MNIVPEPLSGASRLAQDYMDRFDLVSGFYGGNYRDGHSWVQRLDWLDRTEENRISRKALAACLRSYNERFNPHEAVHKSLDLLEQEGTLVITGGQQSGLFTGPMLVVHKAVTIIQAAREAEKKLGRPVVPLFWIAGEDHDWDEVNHTYVMSDELEVSKIRMHHKESSRTSVSFTAVKEEQWKRVLDEMQQLLQDSEHKSTVMDLLRKAVMSSAGLSDAFAKLMGEMFGKYGLVLLDSADPNLRALEIPIFEKIIRKNDSLGQSYQLAARDMMGLGYDLQADVAENGANLFYLKGDKRILLFKNNGEFTDRKGLVSFSETELLAELIEHPERFSNNVLTRPIMQDSLLPVLGTVLGQGEISYWAITRYAFEEMGLQMPLILPRMSFTIVDSSSQKYMEKYNLTFQEIHASFEVKRKEWLSGIYGLDLDQRFEETKESFNRLYEPLLKELSDLQPGLMKLGQSNQAKILAQMDFLLNKTKSSLEQQQDALLRQWELIRQSIAPLGRPQERVYNIYYYLNRYGLSLVDELMSIPYDDSGIHRAVYL
ncbi:bacillithiol biosynthesis cysteine-adding enzyme BshC [Paenibacillus dakarensis]|uniref:bacillithiol biosynthesis cysteine-adding enzyme BshC n=1 Tax=Paenibacillus dakarensis TaxID=1527293 RepID=UPI0006D58FB4|nr:bacillithiol biosynthesis cysteine-adding enzyme BshC [Paenibacillus dakarensis]